MALRISEAARMIGVHPQTLREWDARDILKPQRLGTQRYYTLEQIQNFMRDDRNIIQKTKVIYCRVSSAKQREDLERQINYMRTLFPGYEVVSEIASGVNFNRDGLNNLIRRICLGEVDCVAVSYKDRLARIGFELIEKICEIHNCRVVVANNIETSPEEDMVEDLIAITTSFSARIHGLRKYTTKFSTKFIPQ
jgi:predicted site-specific integrase-resolvase